jgi:hypothetical protein
MVFVHRGALEESLHSTRSSGLKVTGVTLYSIIVTRFSSGRNLTLSSRDMERRKRLPLDRY